MHNILPMSKNYSGSIWILLLLILNSIQSHEVQNSSLLLYATTVDIRFINITGNEKKSHLLYANNKDRDREITFDFHYAKKKICWTNHLYECIQCDGFDGYKFENKVENITTGVLSPDGLAYDWFTDKLYWIDSESDKIEVASIKEKYRKVLFWSDLDQPRAIAVVPMKGYIFWTDWGDIPKIERGGMNGNPSTRKVIVSQNISWPNSLSIDYEKELIYWIDAKYLRIDVMDYNGRNRKTVVKSGIEYPFALTQFQSKLYWTDWKTRSIYYYDTAVKTGGEPENYFQSVAELMDIHVWDIRRQPYQSHPCETNNGGCSHICLLAPHPPHYTCACPIGIKLIDNLTCANDHEEILILARRTDINIIYLDSPEYSYKPIELKNVKYAIAIDYDPIDGYIYWTDDEEAKIQKAKLDGTDQMDVISWEIHHSDGIAIDWIGRNIYWTDSGIDHIEVASLNGKYRKVIIFEDLVEPRAIVVAPELGWLFWSDWNEKTPRIERSNLDGTERRVIIDKEITWPNGIALDIPKNKIYWSDAGKDRIEYSNMDGTDRRTLIDKELPHVFGFCLMGENFYWTDWQKRSVDRANKETGSGRESILDQVPNVMGLKAVNLSERHTNQNPCGIKNGGCSQLCLYRHDKSFICACQIDYELMQDKKTCVLSQNLLFYSQKSAIRKISIENANLHETTDNKLPITGLKQINSIDFDINNNRIYWSDKKLIMRSYMNGSDPQRVIELGLSSPDGIAIDWQAHNIYWTDSISNRIEVARVGGSSRRTLLWTDLYEPHSIVLDSTEGFMYWTEWGQSGSIKKACMDGTNRTTLILNSGHALLAIDNDNKRLYWTDIGSNASIIRMSDLNGFNKKVLLNETNTRITALTIYKNFLYWSDENNGQLWKINKETGEDKTLVNKLSDRATYLSSWYKNKQKHTNQCSVNNGGCSHLCLALPRKTYDEQTIYTCACPTHYILQNKSCIAPTKFMIYSQRNLAVRLLPDSQECLEAVLPIHRLKNVKAIDFDPVHQNLYWIEGKMNSIKKASILTSETSIVVPNNKHYHPVDLAVDSLGQLLFWSCSTQNVINVTRLDNGSTVGIVVQNDDEKPRLLAIHPTKRLLFYTDVGPNLQLVRIRMDGSQRIVINKGHQVAALAIDIEGDMIVWAQDHTIYMSTIDGDNPEAILNESNSKVTQLSVHSGYMYWLDTDINEIQRLELKTGHSRATVLNPAAHIVNLISVTQLNYNHSCSQITSKKCSHICIVNGSSPLCACPHGLALQDDKRTCSAAPDCGVNHFTCSTAGNKDCIPLTWKCDGVKDCHDGSDEGGCPVCKVGQFHCQNGECIDENLECDGIPQCSDQSDEAKCCQHPKQFKCPLTDVCIPATFLCDGLDHCADGADERASVCKETNSYMTDPKAGVGNTIIVIFVILSCIVVFSLIVYFVRKKLKPVETQRDQSEDPLNPTPIRVQFKNQKIHKGIPDVVHMSMVNGGSNTSSYDRNNITGASSSTNGSSLGCYPRETLNPPPSPATTAASTRGSSPSTRHRPYKHYRYINQPPPPTPCSTDVCDESDYNYPTNRSRYDGGPFPPPPTPRSHCHSESCPPSPGSRSSTYFSPLPPPPSPVASPRGGGGYDT